MVTMLDARNDLERTAGEVGFMNKHETSMEKHRRLKGQAGEIADFAQTFGPLAAMDRYDIHTSQTLKKLIHKGGGNAKLPLVDKRFMFNTPQDYYDGLVQATINRIVKLQTDNSEKDRVIGDLKAQIQALKDELRHHSSMDSVRQEKKMAQLLKLVKGDDGCPRRI